MFLACLNVKASDTMDNVWAKVQDKVGILSAWSHCDILQTCSEYTLSARSPYNFSVTLHPRKFFNWCNDHTGRLLSELMV